MEHVGTTRPLEFELETQMTTSSLIYIDKLVREGY
jgi:hypothetical protein